LKPTIPGNVLCIFTVEERFPQRKSKLSSRF